MGEICLTSCECPVSGFYLMEVGKQFLKNTHFLLFTGSLPQSSLHQIKCIYEKQKVNLVAFVLSQRPTAVSLSAQPCFS